VVDISATTFFNVPNANIVPDFSVCLFVFVFHPLKRGCSCQSKECNSIIKSIKETTTNILVIHGQRVRQVHSRKNWCAHTFLIFSSTVDVWFIIGAKKKHWQWYSFRVFYELWGKDTQIWRTKIWYESRNGTFNFSHIFPRIVTRQLYRQMYGKMKTLNAAFLARISQILLCSIFNF